MLIHHFDYDLPKRLIAQSPTLPRDYCRLLVYDRKTDQIFHDVFFHLTNYLDKNDVLVLNKTKVIPVRLNFEWNGRQAELFFVENLGGNYWSVMGSPGKIFETGLLALDEGLIIKIKEKIENQLWKVEINLSQPRFLEYLYKYGRMPLPPYIKNYQNVGYYSSVFEEKGLSVAAPTAGLHFTKRLLNQLEERGVDVEYVNLEVGLGTFMPVKTKNLVEHQMHREFYEIDRSTAQRLNFDIKAGKRLVMVGTTVVRTLEDNFMRHGKFVAGRDSTNIFITMKDQFKVSGALLTNFHLPKSTLLVLVSAFVGREKALAIYDEAVKYGYTFFSYGDAMLII